MVVLKSLNNSQDINADFLHEITGHQLFENGHFIYDGIVRCHKISQDPKTQNYIMVMGYISGGNLRQCLNQNRLTFESKLIQLFYIACGLKNIHNKGLIHKDLHSGNILINYNTHNQSYITDLGLSRLVNKENDRENIYGVLPYMAPEVLRGKQYIQAADIYSFGIVTYELFSGLLLYHLLAHDGFFALNICQGF